MASGGAVQRARRTLNARAALVILLGVATPGLEACRTAPPLSSEQEFLSASWAAYRRLYIDQAGYVLDRTRNGGEVTSEGQSYALLRAAWIGDAATFDRVFSWTEKHLLRSDGLYSWRWAPQQGGRVLDVNTASDADQDIAFALMLASDRFGRPDYRARAATLLPAIRAHESLDIADGWLPAAGNWAVSGRVVNLSYFVPYAYEYFDRIDPQSRWLDARRVGYQLLERTTPSGVAGLPPDFMTVSAAGAPGPLPANSGLGSTFSFDAIRIAWRLAMDCRIRRAPEACGESAIVSTLVGALRTSGALVTNYDASAQPLTDRQSPTFYACLLPALQARHVDLAATVRQKYLSMSDLNSILSANDRYYDANWLWFGLALADGLIPERTPSATELSSPSR